MDTLIRRVAYAISFEGVGILVTGVVVLALSTAPTLDAYSLSTAAALIGVIWSFIYNSTFEAWEARQSQRGRSRLRRLVHSVLFEVTLLVQLLPLTMWWLSVGLSTAIGIEAGVSVVFVFYTYAFTWSFDRIFGLPQSAL